MVLRRSLERRDPATRKWTFWRDVIGLLVVAIAVALLLSVTPGVVGP